MGRGMMGRGMMAQQIAAQLQAEKDRAAAQAEPTKSPPRGKCCIALSTLKIGSVEKRVF